jgi:hypothetical protein
VTFYTSDGTANAGFDYTATAFPGLRVSFGDGQTNANIDIPITDDSFVEGNETFFVTLTNATGGAVIVGSNSAPVTIIENDAGFAFSAPSYLVDESGESVTLTVLRLGGSNGVAFVRYSTEDVTANAGSDYAGITNNLLFFANGETLKTFAVTIFEDTEVEGDETFRAVLSNPSPGMQLLNSTAVVSILDNDAGLAFAPLTYSVSEGVTNVVITVLRTNANTGSIGFSFATSHITAAAYVQEGWIAADVLLNDPHVLAKLKAALPPHIDWLLKTQQPDGGWGGPVEGEFARTPAIVDFLIWYDQRCESRADVREAIRRGGLRFVDPKQLEAIGFYTTRPYVQVERAIAGRALVALSRERYVL